VVIVRAGDLGLTGTETPMAIDDDRALMARLEAIRTEAAQRMGIPGSAAVPKIALVAPAGDFTALDGVAHRAADVDVLARVISMGNCHRAVPLTVAMCLAVAARVPGSLVQEAANVTGDVRLGHPSGILPIDATVSMRDGGPWAERVTVYRTARRLMEGFVRVP
jgi:2-methylaconitate cis-trans-isomerase PrpF